MAFNPLEEKGIPVEKQLRSWKELNSKPVDKDAVDAYTRCRIIVMNGAEMEAMWFSHQFARHTDNMEIKRYLAMGRRIEMQQQKAVNWLLPGDASVLETTIGYEQVAIDLTAWLARMEPDRKLKQAYDFGLLEDFDHLYRYADLLDFLDSKKAEKIVDGLTEIMPGRPTIFEHRHPHDELNTAMDGDKADPFSMLHMMTLVAAEQQTLNFYCNAGNMPEHPLARALYLEIAQIEEQHVTHYESCLDPTTSWWKREVLHQYNECYLYYSFMQTETDKGVRKLWEQHLDMELGQLRQAVRMFRKFEKGDPSEFLPREIGEPLTFEPNKEYVRGVLAEQVGLTKNGTKYVPTEELPEDHRYHGYQKTVNNGGVPSEQVIKEYRKANGTDYRLETEGPHPIKKYQQKG